MSYGATDGEFLMLDDVPSWRHPDGVCHIQVGSAGVTYAKRLPSSMPDDDVRAACAPYGPAVVQAFLAQPGLTERERRACEDQALEYRARAQGVSWITTGGGSVAWNAPGGLVRVVIREEEVSTTISNAAGPVDDHRFLIDLACMEVLAEPSLPAWVHRLARTYRFYVERTHAEGPDSYTEEWCGGDASAGRSGAARRH